MRSELFGPEELHTSEDQVSGEGGEGEGEGEGGEVGGRGVGKDQVSGEGGEGEGEVSGRVEGRGREGEW